MFISEYGDKNNPLVLLLAPMMVSGEDLYQLMHPFLNTSIITSRRIRAVTGKPEPISVLMRNIKR